MTKRRKIIFGAFTGLASCALLGTASGACAMISNNRQVELKNLQSSTNQLEQAQAQINQLKSQCETYQAQIQKMSEQLTSSNSTSSSTDTKKEPSGDKTLTPSGDITPWLENKLKSLTSYLDKIKADLTTAQDTINQQQAANKKLQESLTNATATQQITESQYQDSQNTIKSLQSEIQTLQTKLQNANAQINSTSGLADTSIAIISTTFGSNITFENVPDIPPMSVYGGITNPTPNDYGGNSGIAIVNSTQTATNSITNPVQVNIAVPLIYQNNTIGIDIPYFNYGTINLMQYGPIAYTGGNQASVAIIPLNSNKESETDIINAYNSCTSLNTANFTLGLPNSDWNNIPRDNQTGTEYGFSPTSTQVNSPNGTKFAYNFNNYIDTFTYQDGATFSVLCACVANLDTSSANSQSWLINYVQFNFTITAPITQTIANSYN